MKLTLASLLLLLGTYFVPVQAAIIPVVPDRTADSTLAGVLSTLTPQAIEQATGRKMGRLRKLQLKILQKKLRKQVLSDKKPTTRSTKVLSVISMITGALGLIALLSGLGFFLFLFTIASIITGIIALSNNDSKKHRTMAILGLVLGGITIAITLVASLVSLALLGGWQ
jgi:hypothetical protein